MAIKRDAFFARANPFSIAILRGALSVLGVPLEVGLANTLSLAIDSLTDGVVTATNTGTHIIRRSGFTFILLARGSDTGSVGLANTNFIAGTRTSGTIHGLALFCNSVVLCIERAARSHTRNAVASFDTCHGSTRVGDVRDARVLLGIICSSVETAIPSTARVTVPTGPTVAWVRSWVVHALGTGTSRKA
eukprot:scaffold6717_cov160-Amphora_coffeaeformis.AAC.6